MKTLTERTASALAWIDSQLAICNAATAGPWYISPDDDYLIGDEGKGHIAIIKPEIGLPYPWYLARIPNSSPHKQENAAFIAASRTGYPEMLEGMKVEIEAFAETASFYHTPSHFSEKLEQILTRIEALL